MEESIKTRIVTAASRCDVGRVRKINQDTVFCSLEPVGLLPNLFIVADGMGGHKAGDLASTEAVRCFVKCIEERSREAEDIVDLMRLALEEANRYVYYLSKESEDYQGMGTTFVAVTFCGNSLYCINVGDILHSCTFMHGIEEIIQPPYIRRVTNRYIVDGTEREYIGNDDFGWGSEFQRIEEILEYPDIRKGKLGAANAYLIDARALLAAALSKMWAEPYSFVTDISKYL